MRWRLEIAARRGRPELDQDRTGIGFERMWRVEVLGGLTLKRGDLAITRFESRKVGALLAYLALHPHRSHSRETLIDLCWPDADLDVGRQRLRQALSSLRRQLEPPGTPPGSILIADRNAVRLNPAAVSCDAVEFERLHAARRFEEASRLYAGELLPYHYDDWVQDERARLAALYDTIPPLNPPDALPRGSASAPDPPVSDTLLPPYVTVLFGRELERDRLAGTLDLNRLVTLTGFGGVGKTRLAVETARMFASRFRPVVFVPLADCGTPDRILECVRAALHLPASELAPLDQVAEALDSRRALLVLDNFEHLVPGGEMAVATLLARLPGVTCLVTSRRALGIEGERQFVLEPLPSILHGDDIARAAECESVALFVNRAQSARPSFQVTERNLRDLVAVCSALEGIPLSLEIAASKIRSMSIGEMSRQISGRLRWLERTGPTMDRTPRHRSLSGVLDWSWALMDEDQQRFLCRLAAFRGGWTSEHAAEVCGAEDARRRLMLLAADSLVRRSESEDGRIRYQMLDIVRRYAEERQSAEDRLQTRRRHRRLYVSLSLDIASRRSLAREEASNVRAAMESAVEDGDALDAFDLLLGIGDLWLAVSGAEPALSYCRAVSSIIGGETAKQSRALSLGAEYALITGDSRLARHLALKALALSGKSDEARASALISLSRVDLMTGEDTTLAAGPLEEAIELARGCGADALVGAALRNLGRIANRRQEYDLAHSLLSESVRMLERSGDEIGAIHSLDNLANTSVQRGELDRALEIYAECQRRALAAGDLSHHAKIHQNIATVLARQKRWTEAIHSGRECVRLCHAYGNAMIVAYALWNLPEPLAMIGEGRDAALIIGFAERYWTEKFGPLSSADCEYIGLLRRTISASIGSRDADAAWESGRSLSYHDAVSLALACAPSA